MTLELSKVPLIPPDPTTLPVGGRLGYFHLNWKFLGAHPSVIKTLEFGLELPIGSVRIPLSRVPLINSHYSSLEKNLVLCQAVVDMLLKGAIQEVRDSSSLAFYSRLFLVAKKTGGWRPVIDLSHLNLYLDFPTFRMETTQSIRNSLQVGQWTTSLDLKDAYFHVPMAPTVHKLLRFQVFGKVYQFVAMPFGLATAPREFTTLVKEVKRMALRLGISVHMYQVQTHVRLHMRHLQFHLRRNYNCHLKGALDSPFTLDPSVKVHLRWWLLRNNVMAQAPLHPPKYVTSIYTDASAQGWGAHCAHMIAQGYWSTQQSKLHINVLELKAVLLALKTFVPQLSLHQRIIQVASDNTTVCAYINKLGGTRSWDMFAITWHLFAFCRKNKVVLTARHVPGVMNLVADQLSRSQQTLHTEWSLNPKIWKVAVTNRLPTSNRSLCHKIQSQAAPVCFSSVRSQGSGSRCPGDELVRTSSLLLPSYSSLSTCGQEVNQLSELQDASCCSSLGNQRVASGSIGIVNKKTNRSSSKRKSLKATSSRGVSSKSKESKPSCLLAEVSLEKKGFSQKVTSRILSPIRKSSKSVYEAKWNGFCTWCEEHGFSAMHPTVPIIAEFFLFLFSEKKLLPQTIEGYRSALSMKLDADLELGSNKELKRLIQSFYKSKPKTTRHIPSWDLTSF